jgi:hypothetical protein
VRNPPVQSRTARGFSYVCQKSASNSHKREMTLRQLFESLNLASDFLRNIGIKDAGLNI